MEHLLWYKHPAKDWNEALPVGNGRLGAMVWGKVGSGTWNRETIDLNEDTLWYGMAEKKNEGGIQAGSNPTHVFVRRHETAKCIA